MEKSVLVTGASGYLGKRLVPALLDDGWTVHALVNQHDLSEALKSRGVHTIQADLTKLGDCVTHLPPVQAVCHLAAVIPTRMDNCEIARRCYEVNALASVRLAEMALALPDCRFIYISTANSYSPGDTAATEECAIYPYTYAVSYFVSKLAAELYLGRLQAVHGLPLICLRLTSVYGPDMPVNGALPRFIEAASRGGELEIWDEGLALFDWVYVDDVVHAILLALQSNQSGVYNIGSGVSHSVLEMRQAGAGDFSPTVEELCAFYPPQQLFAAFARRQLREQLLLFGIKPRSLRTGLTDIHHYQETRGDALGGL